MKKMIIVVLFLFVGSIVGTNYLLKNTDIGKNLINSVEQDAEAAEQKSGMSIEQESRYLAYTKETEFTNVQKIIELENALNHYTLNEESKDKLIELAEAVNESGTKFLEKTPDSILFVESNHHLAIVVQYLVEATNELPDINKETKREVTVESMGLLEKAKKSLKEWARVSLDDEEEYYTLLGDEEQLAQWKAEKGVTIK